MSFSFANPWALALLLLLPLWWWWRKRVRMPAVTFPGAATLAQAEDRASAVFARIPEWMRAAGIAAVIFALAGPRTGAAVVDVNAEGIAIVVALDISSSMLAEDFSPRNRLSVAKERVADFVRGRRHDRIGLVAFAGEALTQVPITIDYPVILQALANLQAGTQMLEDGTAIGTALATAANRLRRAPGESRVIVLMTDGENNRGEIDPITAARAAAAYGIRIYTIGVGREGVAPVPVASGPFGIQYANLPVHIDEELLRGIAGLSGGQYFRATNAEALDSVYHRIDELEKSDVEVRQYMDYTPRHLPLLFLAVIALIIEWAVRASRWGRVP